MYEKHVTREIEKKPLLAEWRIPSSQWSLPLWNRIFSKQSSNHLKHCFYSGLLPTLRQGIYFQRLAPVKQSLGSKGFIIYKLFPSSGWRTWCAFVFKGGKGSHSWPQNLTGSDWLPYSCMVPVPSSTVNKRRRGERTSQSLFL